MAVLALLAGTLLTAGVYMLMATAPWRRLVALALIGQALPLFVVAAGGRSSQAITIAVALELAVFAFFLAAAAFMRHSLRAPSRDEPDRAQP